MGACLAFLQVRLWDQWTSWFHLFVSIKSLTLRRNMGMSHFLISQCNETTSSWACEPYRLKAQKNFSLCSAGFQLAVYFLSFFPSSFCSNSWHCEGSGTCSFPFISFSSLFLPVSLSLLPPFPWAELIKIMPLLFSLGCHLMSPARAICDVSYGRQPISLPIFFPTPVRAENRGPPRTMLSSLLLQWYYVASEIKCVSLEILCTWLHPLFIIMNLCLALKLVYLYWSATQAILCHEQKSTLCRMIIWGSV